MSNQKMDLGWERGSWTPSFAPLPDEATLNHISLFCFPFLFVSLNDTLRMSGLQLHCACSGMQLGTQNLAVGYVWWFTSIFPELGRCRECDVGVQLYLGHYLCSGPSPPTDPVKMLSRRPQLIGFPEPGLLTWGLAYIKGVLVPRHVAPTYSPASCLGMREPGYSLCCDTPTPIPKCTRTDTISCHSL